MLLAKLCTKKINLADLKNRHRMADKLGVLNISNSKENEDCFTLKVPIQKCSKMMISKNKIRLDKYLMILTNPRPQMLKMMLSKNPYVQRLKDNELQSSKSDCNKT